MPKIPASQFIRRMPSEDTPSRIPVAMDSGAAQAPWAALRRTAEATSDFGVELAEASNRLRMIEDNARIQDYLNRFNSWSRGYILEQKKLSGDNALGITKASEPVFQAQVKDYLEKLPTEASRQSFYARAVSHMDSHLNSLATHELSQLEKYRNDTVQATYTDAHEEIRLSNGDPKLVEKAIQEYDKVVQEIYAGQDTTRMRQNHRSLLEKAGREARNRFSETAAFDIVRDKFTTVGADGLPAMDYAKAKNYLLDNPDNIKEISDLTIEKRQNLANIIWADGARAHAEKVEAKATNAAKMWAIYNRLLLKEPPLPGEPASFLEWHRNVEQLTLSGQLDESVLKTAISYTKAEEALERQLKAASEAEKRRLEADRQRELANSPFIKSNPNVLARVESAVLADPMAVSKTEILSLVGQGLGIQDAIRIIDRIDGVEGKAWRTPRGMTVLKVLNGYRGNYKFSTEEVPNNAGYNASVGYFQNYLMKNPNATYEQVDEEMRKFMYPYIRTKIMRTIDGWRSMPPVLPKE